MPVFLINLKKSKDRLNQMAIKLQQRKLSWRLLEAVDGYELSRTQMEYIHRRPKPNSKHYGAKSLGVMKAGAVGCFLSHTEAFRIMQDENLDQAMILEDDCIFFEQLDNILPAIEKIKDNWHVINLIGCGNFIIRVNKFHEERIGENIFSSIRMSYQNGAAQYIIRKNYAAELLKSVKTLSLPIDLLLFEYPYCIRWPHTIYSYDEKGRAYMIAGDYDKKLQSNISVSGNNEYKYPVKIKTSSEIKKYKREIFLFCRKYFNWSDFLKLFPQKDIPNYNIHDYKKMNAIGKALEIIKSIDWDVLFKHWNKKYLTRRRDKNIAG